MKPNAPGSLLIFNLAIFLILFSLTFICMNLVSVYSAKRELIATTEAALSSSSQHLDSLSYYLGLNRFQNNKKVPINCSLKGESAPSLAGGGLKGLELAVPGIAKKFMTKAFNTLRDDKKLKAGDKVPDVFGKISNKDKKIIVVGNESMGGPIDFMYIGPMNVVGSYDSKKNLLTLNGTLTEAEEFAKSHDLYFRLRARREDQRFDPDAKEKDGTPKVYGKSPSRGDSAGRIVVTDKVPSTGVIVQL